MHMAPSTSTPTIVDLLRIWTGIGLQSFGGGASTQLLIRREFVEKRTWISADELGQFWNLCQLTPGINLVALTILIGRKLGGARGIVASVAGLLVPSATVTCALAVLYTHIEHSAVIHAILQGVVPATAGIMAVVAYSFAWPILQRARHEGTRSLVGTSAIMVVATLVLVSSKAPVVAVLVGLAVLSALLFTPGRLLPTAMAGQVGGEADLSA
jgi:chromate transporter